MANKAKYKLANKEVKKAVIIETNKASENIYQSLETEDGEKEAFKLPRARKRRTRDLGDGRCIKDEDGKVIVEETKIKGR